MDREITLRVNGTLYQVSVDTRTTLLDALRERLGLTGSKKGCDQGACGACTVLIDGKRVLSCLTFAATCEDRAILTIEGLAEDGVLHPMQRAFIRHDAFQCGYCTPGQILSAVALLDEGRDGKRTIPLTDFYLTPGETPNREHVLAHGELITAVEVPLLPQGARSSYLKIRDRASYEFALTSAAVVLEVENGMIRDGCIGLGEVATIPWRARSGEDILRGAPASTETYRAAAEAALAGATPYRDNAFKVELARRTIVRALASLEEMET